MNQSRLSLGILISQFALLSGAIAQGDTITPWAGGSASVLILDKTFTQDGPTASVSESRTGSDQFVG